MKNRQIERQRQRQTETARRSCDVQRMGLGIEDPRAVEADADGARRRKDQEQVLERLGEPEALLQVNLGTAAGRHDVGEAAEAAGRAGRGVDGGEGVPRPAPVAGLARQHVTVVEALDGLGPQFVGRVGRVEAGGSEEGHLLGRHAGGIPRPALGRDAGRRGRVRVCATGRQLQTGGADFRPAQRRAAQRQVTAGEAREVALGKPQRASVIVLGDEGRIGPAPHRVFQQPRHRALGGGQPAAAIGAEACGRVQPHLEQVLVERVGAAAPAAGRADKRAGGQIEARAQQPWERLAQHRRLRLQQVALAPLRQRAPARVARQVRQPRPLQHQGASHRQSRRDVVRAVARQVQLVEGQSGRRVEGPRHALGQRLGLGQQTVYQRPLVLSAVSLISPFFGLSVAFQGFVAFSGGLLLFFRGLAATPGFCFFFGGFVAFCRALSELSSLLPVFYCIVSFAPNRWEKHIPP